MKNSLMRIVMIFMCFVVGFAAVVGVSIAFRVPKSFYSTLAEQKRVQNMWADIKLAQDKEKADTYGGTTPEETFGMFLDALKAGDVDLASKYFVLDKQAEWKSKLADAQNNLSDTVQDFQSIYNTWEKNQDSNTSYARFSYDRIENTPFSLELPDGKGGSIKQDFPAGKYSSDVIFFKNINSKWKISQL